MPAWASLRKRRDRDSGYSMEVYGQAYPVTRQANREIVDPKRIKLPG
jgi:hypothetical protein